MFLLYSLFLWMKTAKGRQTLKSNLASGCVSPNERMELINSLGKNIIQKN